MIEMLTGHLGSGSWKIKEQDGIQYLSHRLAFSPKSEYRIGADEILDVQVQSIQSDRKQVEITLTDGRNAQALVSDDDLSKLINLISLQTSAPEFIDSQKIWVKWLIVFLIVGFIFELAR